MVTRGHLLHRPLPGMTDVVDLGTDRSECFLLLPTLQAILPFLKEGGVRISVQCCGCALLLWVLCQPLGCVLPEELVNLERAVRPS